MATRQSVREFGDSLAFLIQSLLRANQEAKMKQEADQQFSGAFTQKPVMAPSSTVNVGGMPAQLQKFQGIESQPNYQMLAQLMASSNPLLAQKSANYVQGQKAVQSLQPPPQEYDFQNTAAGLYRTDKRSGAASPIPGTQPPMIKPSFKTDNVTVDENGKPMQYRIVTDEFGNEVRREKIGPSYQKPDQPNLSEGFSQITDPKVKADLFNKTYGTNLPPEAFFKDEDKPTQTTKTMMEAAPKVKNLVNRIVPTLQALSRDLGPIGGRWNDFMTGKIGVENEEYNKLRVNVGLLTTLLMRMHVGARGSNVIMQKFDNLIGLGYQDPRNLLAAIGEIGVYADDVAAGAKSGGKSGGSFWDK